MSDAQRARSCAFIGQLERRGALYQVRDIREWQVPIRWGTVKRIAGLIPMRSRKPAWTARRTASPKP